MMKDTVSVRVTHQFAATAERVFDAWLDPKTIGQFMFGSRLRAEEILHLNVDARVGGTFSFLVRRGGQEIDHIGRYEAIERPRRLVFTWAVAPSPIDSSRVTIDIVPRAQGCELTLTHDLVWPDYAERTKGGWTRMIEELAKVL